MRQNQNYDKTIEIILTEFYSKSINQIYLIIVLHFISLVDSNGRQSRNLPYVPVYQQQFLKIDDVVQSIGQ